MLRHSTESANSGLTRIVVLGAISALLATGNLRSAELPPLPGPAQNRDFRPATKDHTITPLDALRQFEPAVETDYHLGEGDEIELSVWGRPELSGKYIVGPDGKITLPYAGTLKVAGLTRNEAAAAAQEMWKPLYDSVVATVTVTQYDSNRIFVLGRVSAPGVLKFDYQPTLLEAVTRAGGLPIGGIGAEKAALTRCMIFRGRDQLVWVDLKSLLNGSDLRLNIRLQRNDVLYIPDSDDQLIYVLGEVEHPGAVRLTPDMTFLDALAQAGGPTRDAVTSRMRLVRHSAGTEREIALTDLTTPSKNPNVALNEGDIVYVPRSGMSKIGYLLEQLSPAMSWGIFGAALGGK